MIIPYQVDVPLERWPISNYLIIVGNITVFVFQMIFPESYFEPFVSQGGFNPKGSFGSMWLHGNLLHLVGNMLFLWVFGNAVCAKVGNFLYPVLYVLLGLIAESAHVAFDGRPAIGASGAINGVVGMYLVFYALNSISCLFVLLLFPYARAFSMDSFWVISFWFFYDILGTIFGSAGGVSYVAHVGGFIGGFIFSIFLLQRKIVQMHSFEKSILEIWRLEKPASKPGDQANEDDFDFDFEDDDEDEAEEEDDGWTYIEPLADSHEEKLVLIDDNFVVVANESVHFTCECGEAVKIKVKYGGRVGRCPNCKNKIRIPAC